MELLYLYFDFIHDQFHSLFHRPSLEEDVLRGTVPPIILYGIMALSARFVRFENLTPFIFILFCVLPFLLAKGSIKVLYSHRFSTNPAFATVDPKDRSKGFGKECAKLLDLEDISLTTIQACVLLGCISITDGKSGAEAVYYCVAARMALLQDLANTPTSNLIEAEVNKRGMYIHFSMASCE